MDWVSLSLTYAAHVEHGHLKADTDPMSLSARLISGNWMTEEQLVRRSCAWAVVFGGLGTPYAGCKATAPEQMREGKKGPPRVSGGR